MIVVDSSVMFAALADDGIDGDKARERLNGERLAAPESMDVEVLAAWRRQVRAGRMDVRRVGLALADLRQLRIRRARHVELLPRCWELRHNLTPYDAVYVALAEVLEAVLLTADRRLAFSPGVRCPIELLR